MKYALPRAVYDSIGAGYRRFRRPDPRIARHIRAAIGNASSVCNIGAGTGSYEPTDLQVTPVEPSQRMIDQRDDSSRVIRASAEDLPFEDGQFDVAMAVLTVHHWADPVKGLTEMKRVSRRQVILTFEPLMIDSFWLVHDYFPEFAEFDKKHGVPIDVYLQILNRCTVTPVKVPWDCVDGFLAAYWRRPEMYLDPAVRNSISSFALHSSDIVAEGISRLACDIESGVWVKRNAELLDLQEMDFGYRLLVTNNVTA